MNRLRHIFWLGIKELFSLKRDFVLLILVAWAFTGAVYMEATGISGQLHNASVAIVDEDQSGLSQAIRDAIPQPYFQVPVLRTAPEAQAGMDQGQYLFVLTIPHGFEQAVLLNRNADILLNADATAVNQAGKGAGYLQEVINNEVARQLLQSPDNITPPVRLVTQMAFNPNAISMWFTSLASVIDKVTMLTIILTGAALIREREHGTLEHLMVMPLKSWEILLAKVWANGLVILIGVSFALLVVIRQVLAVPIAGSVPLYLCGTVLFLLFATAFGVFLGTVVRSMPQLGLMTILVILPMMLLSGGKTPVENQPDWMQTLTWFLPSRHYVSFSQAILLRDAGISTVWPAFLMVGSVAIIFFFISLLLFRRSLARSR